MSQTEYIEMLRKTYQKTLLTKAETANELNISIQTLDRIRKTGQLRSKRILRSIMFSLDEIARYVYES